MILRTMIAASAVIGLATVAYAEQNTDKADGLKPGAKPMTQQQMQAMSHRQISNKVATHGETPSGQPMARAANDSK